MIILRLSFKLSILIIFFSGCNQSTTQKESSPESVFLLNSPSGMFSAHYDSAAKIMNISFPEGTTLQIKEFEVSDKLTGNFMKLDSFSFRKSIVRYEEKAGIIILPVLNEWGRIKLYVISFNGFKVDKLYTIIADSASNANFVAWRPADSTFITTENGFGADPGPDYLTFFKWTGKELNKVASYTANSDSANIFYNKNKSDSLVFEKMFIEQIKQANR